MSQEDGDVMKAVNLFAHKVQIASKLSQKEPQEALGCPPRWRRPSGELKATKKSDEMAVVKREKDIHKIERLMYSAQDRKTLAKAAKKAWRIVVRRCEIMCMVDSGRFEHAINAEDELPGYVIEPPNLEDQARTAETACGGVLKILGRVLIRGFVARNWITMPFKNMKVKCPMISVRRLVHDGHEVHIDKSGGWIKHIKNGKSI